MRFILRGLASGVGTLLAVSMAWGAPDKAELAQRAESLFKLACYRCHGMEGAAEGGFSFVMEPQRLIATKRVIPGKPDESKVYKKIKKGDMPPEDEKPRLTDGDVDVIRQWIEAGAPDFHPAAAPRKPIAAEGVLDLIKADLDRLPERDRRFVRYFTIAHLYNAGWSEDELESYRLALSKLVNSLSWGRKIIRPAPIDPAKTVLRVDLRDYKWSEKMWASVLSAYPYGISYDTKTAQACAEMTDTPLPYLRADWFVAMASRPPLYHDMLQVPETDVELERLLRIDVEEDIRQERIYRAGFNGSGVSRNNRLIERHETNYGAYWKSYDFGGNSGRQNLFSYPIGPHGKDAFQHDGGEIIFSLPNGLQGYALVDGKGRRIDKGPTSIVSDPKQGDRAVVNGLSCMSCHQRGIIEKADQIRESVLKNPKAFDPKDVDAILALYSPREQFEKLLREDAKRYNEAVALTGGRLDKNGKIIGSDPVVNLALAFERDLDTKLVAAEVDVTEKDLLRTIDRKPQLARTLGALKVPGGTVQREAFIAIFRDLVDEVGNGSPIASNDRMPSTRAPIRAGLPPVKDASLAGLIEKLKGKDHWARRKAAQDLQNLEPSRDYREQVAVALEEAMVEKDHFVQIDCIKALGVWGSKQSVDPLLKMLSNDDVWVRQHAIEALGNIKDPRAIEPIAERLKDNGFPAEAATKALKNFGPAAEKPVLKYVKDDNVFFKKNVCALLKDVGTRESLPALEAIAKDENIHVKVHVRPTAQEAIKAIKERMTKPKKSEDDKKK